MTAVGLANSAQVAAVRADVDILKVFNAVTAFEAGSEPARGVGVIWQIGPFQYQEVASGGDLTNAAGVNLKLLTGKDGGRDLRALGAVPNTTTDYSSLIRTIIARYPGDAIIISGGTYRADTLGSVAISDPINLRGDGTLDGNNNAQAYLNIDGDLTMFRVKGITFTRMNGGARVTNQARLMSKIIIDDVEVNNSQFGFDFDCDIASARVFDSLFEDLTSANDVNAIRLGNNSWTGRTQGNYTIRENTFRRLTKTTNNGECHGVLAYGTNMSINDNKVEDIQNTGNGIGAEGIYAKAFDADIYANLLKDAGNGEAYINIKGSGANSRRVKCFANTLVYSSIGATAGINISCDQVKVFGNELQDMPNYGIRAPRNEIIDASVVDNTIRNCGSVAVMWEGYGESLSIEANKIYGMTGGFDANLASAIYILNENNTVGENIDVISIKANTIRIPTNSAANQLTGIHVRPLSNIVHGRVDVEGNTIEINGVAPNIRDVWIDNDGTIGICNVKGADSANVTEGLDIDNGANFTTLNVDWAGSGDPNRDPANATEQPGIYASPGSVWKRTDGSNGQVIYSKESAVSSRTGWKVQSSSGGGTGGSGSAGAGNQYVEIDINGTTYKVLHDGTI